MKKRNPTLLNILYCTYSRISHLLEFSQKQRTTATAIIQQEPLKNSWFIANFFFLLGCFGFVLVFFQTVKFPTPNTLYASFYLKKKRAPSLKYVDLANINKIKLNRNITLKKTTLNITRNTFTLFSPDKTALYNFFKKETSLNNKNIKKLLESINATIQFKDFQNIQNIFLEYEYSNIIAKRQLSVIVFPLAKNKDLRVYIVRQKTDKSFLSMVNVSLKNDKHDEHYVLASIPNTLLGVKTTLLSDKILSSLQKQLKKLSKKQLSLSLSFVRVLYKNNANNGIKNTIMYLSFIDKNKKNNISYFLFKNKDKKYFVNKKYKRATSLTFIKPLRHIRVTSPFGRRFHPILGIKIFHAGVDLGSPLGTEIYATANGVITQVSKRGGYGYHLRIKSANGYMAIYAHMKAFSKGIRIGSSIKQGQVVGYVGETGMATGPHLHYEVRFKDKPINPLKFRPKSSIYLSRSERKVFIKQMTHIKTILENI